MAISKGDFLKDEVYYKNISKIEEIITQLTRGNLTIEEGKRLKVNAEKLLKQNRDILNQGDGKVILLTWRNGKIVETPLSI